MIKRQYEEVPGEMDTASFKLFHHMYQVRVEAIHLVSADEIKIYGTPTSGVKEFDDAAKHELRDCTMTAIKMAYLHDSGAPISLMNPKDSVEIYQNIQEHIRTWCEILGVNFLQNKPPLEDFRILDGLAAAIYPTSLWAGGNNKPLIGLQRLIANIQGGNALGAIISKRRKVDENGELTPVTNSGHFSYFEQLVGRYANYTVLT